MTGWQGGDRHGRGSGLGLSIAQRFAGAGATVVLSDLASGALESAPPAIGGSASAVACDVTDEARLRSW